MTNAEALNGKHAPAHTLPFERTVLVMQGGGALGAYQAGVYAALQEENIALDWISSVSIGAVNGALIAGNPPETRVQKLRQFWEAVSERPLSPSGWFQDFWAGGDRSRAWTNRVSALNNMLYGVPNFYKPRAAPPLVAQSGSPETASYYDIAPLQATLERLVDFGYLNKRMIRLTIGAANARTGEPVYFDNSSHNIDVRHILASSSLPPSFAPVEIEGDYFWDGGVVTNSPMNYVVNSKPRFSALVFEIDLFDPKGDLPLDVTSAYLRAVEIHGSSRINISLDEFRRQQAFRRTVGKLLDKVAEEHRVSKEFEVLREEAKVQRVSLVRLRYETKPYESGNKIYEFSRRSMEEHWDAGFNDTRIALREPDVLTLPDEAVAARIFDSRTGWVRDEQHSGL